MAEVHNTEGEIETVSSQELTTQLAAESRVSSVRSPWQTFVAANVTPLTLRTMLRNAANWLPETLMQYAQEVEERDPHYRSVLFTRKMAVIGLPWVVTPASEDVMDVAIADFVKSSLEANGFSGLVMDLLDGISKGYSVVEIVWRLNEDMLLVPNEYIWIDQKGLTFDAETQTRVELRVEGQSMGGDPLTPAKFIAHSPKLKSGKMARSGLIFTVSALALMKAYVTKDWLQFSEVFGMPLRYAEALGTLTEDEESKVFKALSALSSNGTAIFGQHVKAHFMGVNTTAHGNFYESAVRFWNQEISKVTLGQTMTSEDGASLAQAKVHDGVRKDIRNSDAKMLAATLNEQLVSAMVDINFGVDVARPKFSFITEEPEDLVALMAVTTALSELGFPISLEWASEKFGVPIAEEGQAVLSRPGAPPALVPPGDGDDGDDDDDDDDDGDT